MRWRLWNWGWCLSLWNWWWVGAWGQGLVLGFLLCPSSNSFTQWHVVLILCVGLRSLVVRIVGTGAGGEGCFGVDYGPLHGPNDRGVVRVRVVVEAPDVSHFREWSSILLGDPESFVEGVGVQSPVIPH